MLSEQLLVQQAYNEKIGHLMKDEVGDNKRSCGIYKTPNPVVVSDLIISTFGGDIFERTDVLPYFW